ncbi:hypothetical protein ACWTU6_19815 [Mesorhizobium sp. BHbsci]
MLRVRQSMRRICAVSSIAALVSGCAVVDVVAPRATTFNKQAAEAGVKTILTNIVRAAYAEPLQFSNLASTSAQGTMNGTIGASIPFPFRGGTGPLPLQTITGTINSTSTAGNTITVNNQNTQEFYQGIQTPLSQAAMFSLMSEGYDARIILSVFVSDIILTGPAGTKVIRNDPLQPSEWNNFYSAVDKLIDNNLDGERISDVTAIGPRLSAGQARDPQVLAALIAAPSGAPSLTADNGAYVLTKREAGFRYCFRTEATKVILAYYGYPNPDPQQTLALNAGDKCGASATERALPNEGVKLQFRTRSIKAAILYLGALARAQIGLSARGAQPLAVPHSDGSTFFVFRLRRGLSDNTWLTVNHRGQLFSLASDPTGLKDGSTRVMQLLTDVLALQSSAKDAPTTNIISVL